jgi:hypothetical protein
MIKVIEKIGTIIEAAGLGIIGFSIVWMVFSGLVDGFLLIGWGIMLYSFGMLIKTVVQLINYLR